MRVQLTGTKDVKIDSFVLHPGDIAELTDRQLYELGPKQRALFTDLAPQPTAEDIAVAAGRATRPSKKDEAKAETPAETE